MARKYVKTFRFWEEDHREIDGTINEWIEVKHGLVGKTIARFELLDIKLTSEVATSDTGAFVLVLIIYTEMRI